MKPDDKIILPEAVNAIDEFNKAMEGVILSWAPGRAALYLEEDG